MFETQFLAALKFSTKKTNSGLKWPKRRGDLAGCWDICIRAKHESKRMISSLVLIRILTPKLTDQRSHQGGGTPDQKIPSSTFWPKTRLIANIFAENCEGQSHLHPPVSNMALWMSNFFCLHKAKEPAFQKPAYSWVPINPNKQHQEKNIRFSLILNWVGSLTREKYKFDFQFIHVIWTKCAAQNNFAFCRKELQSQGKLGPTLSAPSGSAITAITEAAFMTNGPS